MQTDLFKQPDHLAALSCGQYLDYLLKILGVPVVGIFNELVPGVSEVQVKGASIDGILNPFNEALFRQAVDRSGHRPAGQENLSPDGVDGQRSLMQKCLQDTEITCIQTRPGNTGPVNPFNGFGCSAQYQAYV